MKCEFRVYGDGAPLALVQTQECPRVGEFVRVDDEPPWYRVEEVYHPSNLEREGDVPVPPPILYVSLSVPARRSS